MTQALAIETIKHMPPEFEIEELVERLHFIEAVNKGLAQAAQGITTPHEEVKKLVSSWKR